MVCCSRPHPLQRERVVGKRRHRFGAKDAKAPRGNEGSFQATVIDRVVSSCALASWGIGSSISKLLVKLQASNSIGKATSAPKKWKVKSSLSHPFPIASGSSFVNNSTNRAQLQRYGVGIPYHNVEIEIRKVVPALGASLSLSLINGALWFWAFSTCAPNEAQGSQKSQADRRMSSCLRCEFWQRVQFLLRADFLVLKAACLSDRYLCATLSTLLHHHWPERGWNALQVFLKPFA